MDMDMQYGDDMQRRHGHSCNMDLDMQNGHGHAARKSTCCMSKFISMFYVHVFAARQCPSCMSKSMLQGYGQMDMKHGHGHDTQHGQRHGQHMDMGYYWIGADSGQLCFQTLCQKSLRKLAKVSVSAYQHLAEVTRMC
jgi:hypothetical protein